MASMEKEFFWGCELSKDKRQYSWDSEDEELSKADIEQKLVLSRACLGAKAKPNDRNVVEVTTTDISDNSVTHTILSLQCGKTDQCRLGLGFPSSVVFKLVEGNGPVHLTGSVYQELYIDEDDADSDEDEESSNFVKPEAKLASKKRPLASETPKGPPKKLARVEDEDEDESDDDEEEEDDESSEESEDKMEVDTTQKQKTPDAKTVQSKTEGKDAKSKKEEKESEDDDESGEEESDDDDEEEEEDDESDEDESDEDEDESDEDESDEEDEIAASLAAKKKGGKAEQKKPMTNGVAKPDKKPAETKEKPNKTPASKQQPSTPKTGGKKDDPKKASAKTPEPLTMDQIKEKLKKTPTLPKKMDKFKNLMRSSYKITDEGTVTKLWDWLKENK